MHMTVSKLSISEGTVHFFQRLTLVVCSRVQPAVSNWLLHEPVHALVHDMLCSFSWLLQKALVAPA